MADVPLPRPQLTSPPIDDPEAAAAAIAAAAPPSVLELIDRLRAAGHGGWVVGGSVRDVLLGRPVADWDLATDAVPERILELVPDAVYENRFGTVGVRRPDGVHELTTLRRDHDYADHRRPHHVEFTSELAEDLARRDLTVNAMAWGGGPNDAVLHLEDPHDGRTDLRERRLRAVGDPSERFREDALRMIRVIRLAAALDFEIEPATLAAIGRHAELTRHLSGERVAAELEKLLACERPSAGFRALAATGILAVVLPELQAQVDVPQNKVPGEDLWDHTLATVDAAPATRPVVRLAALLHDIGKPATLADGHFLGHDVVGARMADDLLRRLRVPRATADRVVALVRNHMFTYEPAWSDAAVRRLIRTLGTDAIEEQLLLREADDIGSGLTPGGERIAELRRRVADQLAAEVALDRSDLAIDGRELMAELGLEPGPVLGRILDDLLERVVADPSLNDRPTLLMLAQAALAEHG
jgi:putative nucleotidyltransferase with HDIG domain